MANINEAGKMIANSSPQQTIQNLIEKSVKEFKQALPVHMRPERLVRIGLTCIRQVPELAQCTPASFVGALLVSAQLGLEPLAGRAYILPFFNSKTGRKEAQFLVGYRGLAELFYRHEKSVQLNWGIVRNTDEFEFEYGTQAKLRHKPAMNSTGSVIGYYVIAELQGNAKPFLYMSRADCIEHGKRHSKTFDTKTQQFHPLSPWNTDPDAMCLKTVLIQLSKVLPLSIELQRAISVDETSREYREGIDDALDIPTQNWDKSVEELESVETGSPSTVITPAKTTQGIPGEDIPGKTGLSPIISDKLTEKQENAIKELAKKRYGQKWQSELINLIGSEYGIETVSEITVKLAEKLITELSGGIKNGN